MPRVDFNKNINLYTKLQIAKSYIALNEEFYISLRHEEMKNCKTIGYEYDCSEVFVFKHNSKYSCEHTIYFNFSPEISKGNCNFNYFFNTSNVKSAVLDGGNGTVLSQLAQ